MSDGEPEALRHYTDYCMGNALDQRGLPQYIFPAVVYLLPDVIADDHDLAADLDKGFVHDDVVTDLHDILGSFAQPEVDEKLAHLRHLLAVLGG